ncbi:DUF2173 family protein [Guyparkeria hydrothermalis]|uniref:DUF2173 family protein n=1 Tax=Guyparkeria hydrothermalis TaxID=923 RepID=UPI00201FF5CF|nr:DUF2173 family protein [Guyparkeria hydrothermalis]MCL7744127.1 DUF2173 family protein [Guyparkeria hydrothermalis]
MTNLKTLSSVPGAVAAFQFDEDGRPLDTLIPDESVIDRETIDLLGHLCVANRAIGAMQARGWEGVSDTKGFYPVRGFTFVGLDWSTVSRGHQAVVLSNEHADYDAAYRAFGP